MTNQTIAYFCTEYALDPMLPTYAGGLGILAGDYMREANDQNIHVVGVGLFYNFNNTFKLDILPFQIEVPIQDRVIKVQVHVYMVGVVPVYLLDTNVEENDPVDRAITNKLYITDKETRLKQELVLGIGGLRTLEALKINPSVYHLNEGHSAFLGLELIRHEMQKRKIKFEEAITFAKKRIVFTNHTLVAAGREIYSKDLVSLTLTGCAQELEIPISEVVKLGLVQDSSIFSMTILSLRMAGVVNAVSKIHARKASDVWSAHPMAAVTNGIHIRTWDKTGDNVVAGHQKQKQQLLTELGWDSNSLLLGWARRFVEYKRPLAILEDLDRFMTLARNPKYPVKIVFAGEPHENDDQGQTLVQKLQDLIKNSIGDCAVYLPRYNMQLAEKLVSGCDVWLNTPIVGFEACGTSGMKAALNGVLPLTTRDGWIDEVDLTKIGWIIDNDKINQSLMDLLEKEIIPMYFTQKTQWEERMSNARSLILNQFSTTRMLHQYTERLYST